MRFESIQTGGFAGLDSRYEFGPGLNLIVGPNESGKTRLVSALQYGLCGRVKKRGKGSDPLDRLRSWTLPKSGVVRISCTFRLASGRHIDANQNLDEPARSRVFDSDLGRDITPELMVERAPDISRLLGLDREILARTLLVRQGELLGVRDGADAMQSLLQRAATSGALDETANAALARLDEFRSQRIGTEHASSKRPLKASRDLEASTRRSLEDLRTLHANLAEQRARIVSKRGALLQLEAERTKAKAQELGDELVRLERLMARLAQVEVELQSLEIHSPGRLRLPGDLQPSMPAVAPADLARWQLELSKLRDAAVPTAPTSLDPKLIEAELAALPQCPIGDRVPRPDLASLHEEHRVASAAVAHHRSLVVPAAIPPTGPEPHVLREYARQLEQEAPSLPTIARSKDPRGPGMEALVSLLLGLLALGLGAGFQQLVPVLVGLLFVSVGAVLGLFTLRRQRAFAAELAARRAAEADLAEFLRRRSAVEAFLAEHGIPSSTHAVLDAARRHELSQDAVRARGQWQTRLHYLEDQDKQVEQRLRQALAEVGVSDWSSYVSACDERRRLDDAGRRRPDLERLLETSRRDHTQHQAVVCAYVELVARVQAWAREIGLDNLELGPARPIDTSVFELIAARLEGLVVQHRTHQRRQELMSEQATLLGEDTRGSLALRHQALASRVKQAMVGLTGIDDRAGTNAASSLELEATVHDLQRELVNLEATLNERLRGMPSIAEAEEAFDLASTEHARVRRLERLVSLATEHLRTARDVIHRDIAPRLSAELTRVIPKLTGGRWERARISVDDLSVSVFREHEWRLAHELSCGTAEQVYLALRVVLATALSSTEEPPPLILDDVLVHADSERVEELLTWLVELSHSHQVILTTTDDRHIAWAEAHGATIHRLGEGA